MAAKYMICPFLNLFLWTLYLMVLMGYRRIKHYLILLLAMLVLFVPYAKFAGFKPVYRGLDRNSEDAQSVPSKPQSKAQSHTAQLRGFCHTARAFGQKGENYKLYIVHHGMSKMKQNAVLGEIVVKNFDRNRLREHRLNQAVC